MRFTSHRFGALIGMLAVALNLRPVLASVPPLLPTIRHDLALSGLAAGLLTTIPVACMGIFAPLAAWLDARYGAERMILGSVALLGLATVGRGVGGGPIPLYGATAVAGIALAIAGTLLTGFIKARFVEHAPLVMGLYTAGLSLGAATAAGATAPLEAALGGSWHAALAIWSVLAAIACGFWLIFVGTSSSGAALNPDRGHVPIPWRSSTAWVVTIIFALQSAIFYGILTWLAPLYRAQGWTPGAAGLTLSVVNLMQIAGAVAIAAAASRSADRRSWLAGTAGVTGSMLLILALTPNSLAWLWIILLGFAAGGLFPLALTFPLDYADTPAEATALAAMALGVGYILAAIAPSLIGAVLDVSGSYTLAFLVMASLAALLATTALWLRPRRERTGRIV